MKCRDLSINTISSNCSLLPIVVKPEISENITKISTKVLMSQSRRLTTSSSVVDATLRRQKHANSTLRMKSISSGQRWRCLCREILKSLFFTLNVLSCSPRNLDRGRLGASICCNETLDLIRDRN